MRLTREQARSYSSGGGSFFKLEDGKSARVRFLYNTMADIEFLGVHSVNEGSNYALIDCERFPTDPVDKCKWCAGGNNPLSRVVIPLYNVDSNEIQYWTRSQSWVENTLIPILEEFTPNQPLSGQICKIKRTGKTMQDTTYNIIIETASPNDGQQRTAFGEVKDPYEANIIKPADFEFPANNGGNNSYSQGNMQSTRRTNDLF